MSRRVRYQVAVSLDGFIAGPNGEYDWIVMDPAVDFAALYKEFDTVVMGRKTYEVTTAQGGHGAIRGMDVVVFSRTLPAAAYPGVRILNDDPRQIVAALKKKRGRDIWLFGGGELFRTLLDAGLVDTVEVAVMPVLIGAGIPLLPPGAATKLVLTDQKILPASGIVALAYSVPGTVEPAPRIRYIKSAKSRRKKTVRSRRKKATCHGTRLAGTGLIPLVAGRYPTYIVRQLLAFKTGARSAAASQPMRAVVARLSVDDMIAAAAYAATLAHASHSR